MVRRWNIADIAAAAQVSKTTVSRVLNDRPDVDAETSARVKRIIDELGYVRSERAVQLARGRANVVALVASFDTSPWMIEVLRGAMGVLQATHYSLMLHAFPETKEESERLAEQMRGGGMDALMVVALRQSIPMFAQAAIDGLPTIVLHNYGFNDGLPDVAPDEAAGIYEAVDHLWAIGRRRFAIVAGTPDFPDSERRLEAYRSALLSHGHVLDERCIVRAPFTEPSAREAAAELLGRGVPFDALFASSDAMAVGAMRALKQRGLAIPRDVSIVGFDDFSSADYTEPRLTTVHNPLFEMSARATSRLLDAVNGRVPLTTGEEVVRTHLVVRDSSDPNKH
jgi:LacI family transcriptional regulator